MFGFLLYLAFGAAVGGIAKLIVPGKITDGWIPAIAVGVSSSMVAGLLFNGHPAGWVASIVTAVVFIYVYGIVTGGTNEKP